MGTLAHVRAMACLWLLTLLITSQSRAAVLVEYTFGDSFVTATNLPQSVAANLSATPVIGMNSDTQQVVPHSFIQWSTGDMAMRLTQDSGDGRVFHFALQADPGFTFQVTDAAFVYQHFSTAGGGRSISVKPNLDPNILWYNITGGDMMASVGPGSFGWKAAEWNLFVQRTDLTSLSVDVALKGNSSNSVADLNLVRISGDVVAIPEPATLGLLACGGATAMMRRRR